MASMEAVLNCLTIFGYRHASSYSPQIAENLKKYLQLVKEEPGCEMMGELIDLFINRPFVPGLTKADDFFGKRHEEYSEQIGNIEEQLEGDTEDLEDKLEIMFLGSASSKKGKIEAYLSEDRFYPYQGTEGDSPRKDGDEAVFE